MENYLQEKKSTNKSTNKKVNRLALIEYLEPFFSKDDQNFVRHITEEELSLFDGNLERAKNYFYLKLLVENIKQKGNSLTAKDATAFMVQLTNYRKSDDWLTPTFLIGDSKLTTSIDSLIDKTDKLEALYSKTTSSTHQKNYKDSSNNLLKPIAEKLVTEYMKGKPNLEHLCDQIPVPDAEVTAHYQKCIKFKELETSIEKLSTSLRSLRAEHGKTQFREVHYRRPMTAYEKAGEEEYYGYVRHDYTEETRYEEIGAIDNSWKIQQTEATLEMKIQEYDKLSPSVKKDSLEGFLKYWKNYFNHPKYKTYAALNTQLNDDDRKIANLLYHQDYAGLIDALGLKDTDALIQNLEVMKNQVISDFKKELSSITQSNDNTTPFSLVRMLKGLSLLTSKEEVKAPLLDNNNNDTPQYQN